jgi:hypothetical protein
MNPVLVIVIALALAVSSACDSPPSSNVPTDSWQPDTTDVGETAEPPDTSGPDDTNPPDTSPPDDTADTAAPDDTRDTDETNDTSDTSAPDTTDTSDPDTTDTSDPDTSEPDTTDTADTVELDTTPSCGNECNTAGPTCIDGTRRADCGNFDEDPCLELSPPTTCVAPADVCQAGACIVVCPDNGCETVGGSICQSTSAERACLAAAGTGCPTPAAAASCQPGNTCEQGSCDGGCTNPELMLVIDRSSSMSPTWSTLRAGVDAFLAARNGHARTGLRFFPSGTSCSPDAVPALAFGTTLPAGVQPVANDSAPLADALSGLLPAFGDATQAERVIVITDAAEGCKTEAQLFNAIDALKQRGIAVDLIGFGASPAPALAALTGRGMGYRAAPDAASLTAALNELVDEAGACLPPPTAASKTTCVAGLCVEQCEPGTLRTITGTCVLPEIRRTALNDVNALLAVARSNTVEVLARSENRLRHVVLGAVPTITSLGVNVEPLEMLSAADRWVIYMYRGLITNRGAAFTSTSMPLSFDLKTAVMRPNGEVLLIENVDARTKLYRLLDEFGITLSPTSILYPDPSLAYEDLLEPSGLNRITHAAMGDDDVLHLAYNSIVPAGVRVAQLDPETGARLSTTDVLPFAELADIAVAKDGTLHVLSSDLRHLAVGASPLPAETIPRAANTLLSPRLIVLRDGRPLVIGSSANGGLYLAIRQPNGWVDFGLVDATAKSKVMDAVVTPDAALHLVYATTTNELVHRRYAGFDNPCVARCDGRTCGSDGCGGTCGPDCGTRACGELECLPAALINEVKVESASNARDGFVEVYLPPGTDVENYRLVHLSSSNVVIFAVSLEGVGTGYYAVQSRRTLGSGHYRLYRGHVQVDALSLGSGTGPWGEGAREPTVNAGATVGRVPTLNDTQDNATDFQVRVTPTPGAAN